MAKSHKAKTNEYKEMYKEFKILAKRADQRLRELERVKENDPRFKNILKWAYRKAMRNIRSWSGEDADTFNKGVPRQQTKDFTLKQLQAKKADVVEFLNSVTSTKRETIKMFKARADKINELYGTNFTWEELGTVFEDKENNEFYQKGGVTYLQAVSYMKDYEKNITEILETLEDNERIVLRTGNKKANKLGLEILEKYGLDFKDLY